MWMTLSPFMLYLSLTRICPCCSSSMTSYCSMYPSSLSTCAIPLQILLLGITTMRRPTRLAFRIRVSMSAMGSWLFIAVIVSDKPTASPVRTRGRAAGPSCEPLPAGLLQPRDLPRQRELAEHDAADLELAQHALAAAGQL